MPRNGHIKANCFIVRCGLKDGGEEGSSKLRAEPQHLSFPVLMLDRNGIITLVRQPKQQFKMWADDSALNQTPDCEIADLEGRLFAVNSATKMRRVNRLATWVGWSRAIWEVLPELEFRATLGLRELQDEVCAKMKRAPSFYESATPLDELESRLRATKSIAEVVELNWLWGSE